MQVARGIVLLTIAIAFVQAVNIRPVHGPLGRANSLQQIQQNIESQNAISASTIGDSSLFDYIRKGFNLPFSSDQIVLSSIQAHITTSNGVTELVVDAISELWGEDSLIGTFVFYFDSQNLLQSLIVITGEFTSIPVFLTPNNTASWFSGLELTNVDQISIASSTFNYNGNSYSEGLTISSDFQMTQNFPIGGQLNQLTNSNKITGNLLAVFPLEEGQPFATLHIDFDSPIYFGNENWETTNLVLDLVASDTPQISLETILSISNLNGNSQPVEFSISADVSEAQGVEFNGQLQSTWNQAFGLSWLSLQNVYLDFSYSSGWQTTNFNFTGDAMFNFNNGIQGTFQYDSSLDVTQYFITLKAPITDLTSFFNGVLGKVPNFVGDVIVQGDVSFVISNYAHNNYQSGVTVISQASISGTSPLAMTLKTLTSKDLTFGLSLYIPVYSENKYAIDFTLSENGVIQVTPNVAFNGLTFQFDISPAQVSASTTMTLSVSKQEGELTFQVTADIQPGTVTFTGQMQGSWPHPFGFKWINLQGMTCNLAFDIDTATISSFTLDGDVSFTFQDATGSVQLVLADNFDWSFTVGMSIPNLSTFFSDVVGSSGPSMTSQMSFDGSFSLSSYDHNNYQEGLTVEGLITVYSDLKRYINDIGDTSGNYTYNFMLFIPVFSSDPFNVDFSFGENGEFHITHSIIADSWTVQVDITPTPDITLSIDGSINVAKNQGPLSFTASANLDGVSELSLNGEVKGDWYHPFGFHWMNLTDIQVSLDFDSQGISLLSMEASGALTYAVATSTVQIAFADDFSNFGLSFNVFIANLYSAFSDIMEIEPPKDTKSISVEGTFVLTTYNFDNSQPGLTITGSALITPDSQLGQAILSMDKQSTLDFDLSLFIPVFGATPYNVDFSLSESGTLPITKSISLQGFKIAFAIGESPSVSVSTTGVITLNKNPSPLLFDLSASLAASSGFTLAGSLQGPWIHPFGVDWMTLNDVSASLAFSTTELAELNFAGSAIFYFSKSNDTVSVSLQASSDFQDVTLTAQDVAVWSFEDACQKVAGQVPDDVHSLVEVSNTFDISVSTYSNGNVNEGLTLYDSVTLTGDLKGKLKIFDVDGGITTSTFTAGVTIPIFPEQGLDFSIYLSTTEFRLKKNMVVTGVKFMLSTDPASLQVATGLKVNFSKNPELEFDVSGTFVADGSVQLSGDMLGTWHDMFGIKGFDISNVDIDVGFNPAFCAVDFCLNALGLGYTIAFGSENISFYGFAELPEVWDMFLEGNLDGANGLGLSFQNVAIEWDRIVGSNSPFYIDPTDIPADWGIKDTSFYVAPEAGTFNQIHYDAGFWFIGGFIVFDINCTIDVKITSDDFEFYFSINVPQFEDSLRKELGLLMKTHPEQMNLTDQQIAEFLVDMETLPHSRSLLSVKNVSVINFTTQSISGYQTNPDFYMEYTWFGNHAHYHTPLPLPPFYNGFHHFFEDYLKWLFSSKKILNQVEEPTRFRIN